ncbi:MAG: ribonuclease Z [Flavobacterium sp.]|nr:ribonuclease Z [Flavobacterium sp.]
MKVEHQKHSVIIKDTQGNLESFVEKLLHEYKIFEKENIILDLTQYSDLTLKQLNLFLAISKTHKAAKKSFVLVAKDIDFNLISDKLTIVPSHLEAHDLIELDEIERDLGF